MKDASAPMRAGLLHALLRQVGYRVRLVDCATGLLIGVALAGGVLACGVAADHLFRGGLGRSARLAVRVGLLLAEAGMAAWGMAMLLRPLSLRWLARQVERDDPTMHNDVTAAVDFPERSDQPVTGELHRRACRELHDADAHAGLSMRGLRLAGIATAGSAVLMLAVWACVPRTFGVSLLRLLGGSDAPAPSRTEFLTIRPGEGEAIPSGGDVTFAATVRHPGREVLLELRRGDSADVLDGDAVGMDPLGPSPTFSGAEGFSASWRASVTERHVSFRIVTGDATTPWRRLRVLPVPAVERIVARVDWPAYTGRAGQEQTGGNVAGLDGSAVSLEARANLPVERALLELAGGRSFVMAVNPDGRTLRTRFRLAGDDRYRIRYWPADMSDPAESAEFELRALTDQSPTVRWAGSAEAMAVRTDQRIRLVGEARDDFGLRQVVLEIRNARGQRRQVAVRADAPGPLIGEPRLSVPAGQIGQVGETVRLRWLAWDHDPSHEPSASQDRLVAIRPPQSEPTPVLASADPSEPGDPGESNPPGRRDRGATPTEQQEQADSQQPTQSAAGPDDNEDEAPASNVPDENRPGEEPPERPSDGAATNREKYQPDQDGKTDEGTDSTAGRKVPIPAEPSPAPDGEQAERNPSAGQNQSDPLNRQEHGESESSAETARTGNQAPAEPSQDQPDQADERRSQPGRSGQPDRSSDQAEQAGTSGADDESAPGQAGQKDEPSAGGKAQAGQEKQPVQAPQSPGGQSTGQGRSGQSSQAPPGSAGEGAESNGSGSDARAGLTGKSDTGQRRGQSTGGQSSPTGAEAPGGRDPQGGGQVTHEGGEDEPFEPADPDRQARIQRLETVGRALKQAQQWLEPPPDQRDLLRNLGIDRVELGRFVKQYRRDVDAALQEARRDAAGAEPAGRAKPSGSAEIRRDGTSNVGTVSGTVRSTTGRPEDLRSQPVRNVAPRYQQQLEAYFRSVSESSTTTSEPPPDKPIGD